MKTSSKGQQTRTRILEATSRCIAQLGIEKSSVTAIAKEAGLTRSLIGHYFPAKEDLLKKVIVYIAETGVGEIENIDPTAAPEEKFIQMMRNNLLFFLRNPHYFKCFMLFFYFTTIDPEYRAINTQFIRRFIERSRLFLSGTPRLNGRTENEINRLAEAFHWQLIGAIQKFFIVEQTQNEEEYVRDTLLSFRDQLKVA